MIAQFAAFNPPVEIATICRLTLVCVANDGHPSDEGYHVIGDLVYDAGTRRW